MKDTRRFNGKVFTKSGYKFATKTKKGKEDKKNYIIRLKASHYEYRFIKVPRSGMMEEHYIVYVKLHSKK
jgi:hypothetical protein